MSYRKHLYPSKIGLILAFTSILIYFFFNLWPLAFSIVIAFTNASEENLFVNPERMTDISNAVSCIEYLKNEENLSREVSIIFHKVVDYLNNIHSILNYTVQNMLLNKNLTSDPIYSFKIMRNFSIASDLSYKVQLLIVKNISTILDCSKYGFKTKVFIIETSVIKDIDIVTKRLSELGSISELGSEEFEKANSTLYVVVRIRDYFINASRDYISFLNGVEEGLLRERDRLTLKFIGLSNFNALFRDPRFYFSLYKTLLFVATSVPLKVLVGFSLALLYSSNLIYARKWLRGLMLTPWAIPILLSGLTWNFLFQPNGQLGKYLGLNINTNEWHAFLVYNLFETWLAYPFIMTVTMGALASISREIIEASYVDGASLWFRVRKIVLPLIARPLAVATVLTTGASLQAFLVPLLINYGGPTGTISIAGIGSRTGNLNELLILFGYNRATIDKEWGYAAATYLAIVLIIIIYVAVWFTIYKRSRR